SHRWMGGGGLGLGGLGSLRLGRLGAFLWRARGRGRGRSALGFGHGASGGETAAIECRMLALPLDRTIYMPRSDHQLARRSYRQNATRRDNSSLDSKLSS